MKNDMERRLKVFKEAQQNLQEKQQVKSRQNRKIQDIAKKIVQRTGSEQPYCKACNRDTVSYKEIMNMINGKKRFGR